MLHKGKLVRTGCNIQYYVPSMSILLQQTYGQRDKTTLYT